MKNSRLLLTVLFVAVAVAIVGYAYVVFGDRYFGKKENVERGTGNANQNSVLDSINNYLSGQDNQNQNENGNQNENANINGNQNNSNSSNSNANASLTGEVTVKDCDNNCVRLKNSPEDYKYCQQICGDVPISQKNSEEECANLAGLEKDYCFKDLAVGKKDYNICGKIQDAKIKKVCKDRITEDLVQQSGLDL